MNFVPHGCVRASYAASFATDSVEDQWKDSVKQWISQLDYISVRENAGLSILKDLGITNGQQVLDPVFLLERDQWNDLAVQWRSPISEPYALLYDFDNNKVMADFAARIAGKNHWKVISVLKNDHIQENFSQEGPIAFLTLIRNAEVVVSNSFHATAFSLIFEKQFWVFGRHEGINTRMRDLTAILGLGDRMVSDVEKVHDGGIDYDTVAPKLAAAIEDSKAYLDKVLRKAEEMQ